MAGFDLINSGQWVADHISTISNLFVPQEIAEASPTMTGWQEAAPSAIICDQLGLSSVAGDAAQITGRSKLPTIGVSHRLAIPQPQAPPEIEQPAVPEHRAKGLVPINPHRRSR